MTIILIFSVIFILLFATEKSKKIGRISLAILVGAGIIGRIFNFPICVEMFTMTNFLLLVVIYILLYGADRFKEKSKIAILVILGAVVTFYAVEAMIGASKSIAYGSWRDILLALKY